MPSKTETPKEKRKTTIGGQALIEGITMRGPQKTCVVIRKSNGKLEIKEKTSKNLSEKYKILKLPILRGICSLFTSLKDGFSDIEYSASFFEDKEIENEQSHIEKWIENKIGKEKLEKIMTNFSIIMGIIFPIFLFILLPSFFSGIIPSIKTSIFLRNIIENIIRISIFLLFMWSISQIKDIQRTFMYHGAEHKTIFCYELELPLTIENVKKMSRFHPRCGTSFLFVLIIFTTIISCITFSFIKLTNPFSKTLVHIILLPLVAGISYEFNRFAGKYDNTICKILRYPGLMIQHLTVFEPDEKMIEVAIESMKRVIPNDNSDNW